MAYAKQLPRDKDFQTFQGVVPAFPSLQSQSGVPLTSSVISLSDNTTVVNITTVGGAIIGKWGTGSVTGTNFDISIEADGNNSFVVPVSVFGKGMPNGSVVGVAVANGLYNSLAVKTIGSASILTTEY